MRLYASDRIAVSSTRAFTSEGYMTAPGVLARAGVFPYYATELGLDSRDPRSVVKVYRSLATMQKASPTFEGKAITMNHPPGNHLSAASWRQYAIGEVQRVGMSGDEMTGMLTIRDRDAIDSIQHGKRYLSNGYSFELVPRTGKAPDGNEYEYEQENVEGNHVAVVDSARCGSACVIADSLPLERQQAEAYFEFLKNRPAGEPTMQNDDKRSSEYSAWLENLWRTTQPAKEEREAEQQRHERRKRLMVRMNQYKVGAHVDALGTSRA